VCAPHSVGRRNLDEVIGDILSKENDNE
jgi:hypothetical protein